MNDYRERKEKTFFSYLLICVMRVNYLLFRSGSDEEQDFVY